MVTRMHLLPLRKKIQTVDRTQDYEETETDNRSATMAFREPPPTRPAPVLDEHSEAISPLKEVTMTRALQ